MSENKTENQKTSSTTSTKPRTPSRMAAYLSSVGSVLAVVVGIVVAVMGIELFHFEKSVNQAFKITNNTISEMVEEQSRIRGRLDKQFRAMEANTRAQKEQFVNFEGNFKQRLKEQGYQSEDWQLVKARYYLEMAQINAHWKQQPDVTIALLKQADAVLKPFKSARMYKVRQAIAEEISALKSQSLPDTIGLLSQLDALSKQVELLSIHKPTRSNALNSTSKEQESSKNRQTWKQRWSNSVNLLEKLVVIRHHHDAKPKFIPPARQKMMKEAVVLSIQQAQWGLMQQKPKLYQRALREAMGQLEQFPMANHPSIQSIVQQLKKLSMISLDVQPVVPSLALEFLNAVIKSDSVTGSDVTPAKREGSRV